MSARDINNEGEGEMAYRSGRHFLQIPGPSPVPDRIQRAMDMPVIDHRGPEFGELGSRVLERLKPLFKTEQPVLMYPCSGTGAWEAALVNVLSPGDKVLMYETGQFATLWYELAGRIGLEPELIASDWRHGVDPGVVEARLREDSAHEIKAVCCVHNETSTGVVSPIAAVRAAIDAANHPALFIVDTISGLGGVDYRHDEWGVDVTISGSQKGLMLPPGLGFNCVSRKALAAHENSRSVKSYWDWGPMLGNNANGYFPYTPATTLLYGLDEALTMILDDEGLDNVLARHRRHAEATRVAVRHWGLDLWCVDEEGHSPILTTVCIPDTHDADEVRAIILDKFDMSLGTGLGKAKGKVFRIGHLGYINDLTLLGAISGIEMGLGLAGVPIRSGGCQAAMDFLRDSAL
jgi:alanine-glyoxylate transaminase/serine-glyoxylate transaminase/serine-pyruvate transaminase